MTRIRGYTLNESRDGLVPCLLPPWNEKGRTWLGYGPIDTVVGDRGIGMVDLCEHLEEPRWIVGVSPVLDKVESIMAGDICELAVVLRMIEPFLRLDRYYAEKATKVEREIDHIMRGKRG